MPTIEQQILDLTASVLNAYSVVLFLPDAKDNEESGACRITAYFSLGDNIETDCRLEPGQGLVGWILRNRQPLCVPDFDQQHSNLDYYRNGEDAEIRAFMGSPLPTGGALCVDSKSQREFSERDSRLLQLFAQLLDATERKSGVETALSDIPRYFTNLCIIGDLRSRFKRWADYIQNFLGCMAEATGFEYCAFASVNVPRESYSIDCESVPILVHGGEPFFQAMSAGLAGYVLRNGQSVFQSGEDGRVPPLFGSSDDLPTFAAIICIPVMVNMSVRGVVCLGHSEPHPITESLRTFVMQAIGQLNLHLENLYLRNRIDEMMPRGTVYRSAPRRGSLRRDSE